MLGGFGVACNLKGRLVSTGYIGQVYHVTLLGLSMHAFVELEDSGEESDGSIVMDFQLLPL